MSVLTIIDLGAASGPQELLMLGAKLAVRRRKRGKGERPLVLLISSGGSAGGSKLPLDADVTTPLEVLALEERGVLVQEAVHSAVMRATSGEAARFFPRESGVDFASLARTIFVTYLRNGLLLLRAVDEICRTRDVSHIEVVSGDVALAGAIAARFERQGCTVGTTVPRLLLALRDGGRLLKSAARLVRRPSASGPKVAHIVESVRRTDVLLVSESAPMRGMFALVEKELSAVAPEVVVTRLQYGDPSAHDSEGNGAHVFTLSRPDERKPRSRRHHTSLRSSAPQLKSISVSQEMLGVDLQLPLSDLVEGLHVDLFDQQSEHISEAEQILDALRPGLVVVGNDRWWIGQSFVRLAQQRGIRTVMLQDGVATDGAEWFWCTADHLALSGEFLAGCLRDHGVDPSVTSIVGQPRYDAMARELAAERDARRGVEPARSRNRVLFATQTMQDFAFVESVVAALLAVEGAVVTLRPHPSENHAPHKNLAELHRGRVHFAEGRDVFESLRDSDLLVCQSSTVVLEAAMLGIPSVTVNFTGMPDLAPYARHGLSLSASSMSQLTAVVSRLLGDDNEYAQRREILLPGGPLERFLGPSDGESTARTARLIVRLLEDSRSAGSVASSANDRV